MPTSISSLPRSGKPSSVLLPPREPLFRGTTTFTLQTRKPLRLVKTLPLLSLLSMRNLVLGPPGHSSPIFPYGLRPNKPHLRDAGSLLHPCATSFDHGLSRARP